MKSYQLYLLSVLTLFCWWFLAFRETAHAPSVQHAAHTSQPLPILDHLSPMGREELKEALDGDFALMAKLIADWEVDAQLLELEGVPSICHLSKEAYVRAQVLGRLLTTHSKEHLIALEDSYRQKCIVDDAGQAFHLQKPCDRFLPQTYVAASFLLALTNPEQIIALPKGLRATPQLHSPSAIAQIPLDIDRYCSEQLYHAKPEIAFVSHYSHPATIEALRNQGIKLFTLSAIDTLSDIKNALIRIGNVVNRPLEAELLTLFMEATFHAVDNRLAVLNPHIHKQRILYVHHMTHLSLPTYKTLTGQLLQRLGVQTYGPHTLLTEKANAWSIPLDQEQIMNFEPDCMIVATQHKEASKQKILETPAFSTLPATQNLRISCVDEAIQNFPSHYVALAYYDLAQALTYPPPASVPMTQTTVSLP